MTATGESGLKQARRRASGAMLRVGRAQPDDDGADGSEPMVSGPKDSGPIDSGPKDSGPIDSDSMTGAREPAARRGRAGRKDIDHMVNMVWSLRIFPAALLALAVLAGILDAWGDGWPVMVVIVVSLAMVLQSFAPRLEPYRSVVTAAISILALLAAVGFGVFWMTSYAG